MWTGGGGTWRVENCSKRGGGCAPFQRVKGEWKNGHLPPPLLMEKIAKYFCQKNGQSQGP